MDPEALYYIHFERNLKKALGYWIGFLEGIIACKEITSLEAGALKAQCQDLLSKFSDEDAQELITELSQNWPDPTEELLGFIEDIIEIRKPEIGIVDGFINENLFFGFLKGIASDNVINVNEVNALLKFVNDQQWERPEIGDDPRVKDVIKIASIAIEDGVIDNQESAELCNYIAKVVGDSFADTGISEQADTPQLDGIVHSFDKIQFENTEFCLTGSFDVPKSVLERAIIAKGGIISTGVRSTTRYLVLSNDGSENYVTSNAGGKILKSVKMRENGKQIEFIMETTIKLIFS